MTDPSKIKPSHIQRAAYVYVRQSTPGQVEHNRESTADSTPWPTSPPTWLAQGAGDHRRRRSRVVRLRHRQTVRVCTLDQRSCLGPCGDRSRTGSLSSCQEQR
jgi:hypothetical protein